MCYWVIFARQNTLKIWILAEEGSQERPFGKKRIVQGSPGSKGPVAGLVENIRGVLKALDLSTEPYLVFPGFSEQGRKLAGFGWRTRSRGL